MISILMPLYNGIEFLQESISSVINQTYKDWELLIGLNGLSWGDANDVFKIVDELHDDRIKPNFLSIHGKVKTLNILSALAKNEIICLLDVDDFWLPEKLEKQLSFIEKYDVVGTDAEYFGDKDGYPGIFLGEISPLMFSYHNTMISSAIMMKKNDARWDEAWEGLDDYNLWIHLLAKQKTFYNIQDPLIKHRIHKDSYFNNKNEELTIKLKETLPKLDKRQIQDLEAISNNKAWK